MRDARDIDPQPTSQIPLRSTPSGGCRVRADDVSSQLRAGVFARRKKSDS